MLSSETDYASIGLELEGTLRMFYHRETGQPRVSRPRQPPFPSQERQTFFVTASFLSLVLLSIKFIVGRIFFWPSHFPLTPYIQVCSRQGVSTSLQNDESSLSLGRRPSGIRASSLRQLFLFGPATPDLVEPLSLVGDRLTVR